MSTSIRTAQIQDLPQLLQIEQICFEQDRLSKRSFVRFIKEGSHDLIVLLEDKQIRAYALVLYRNGTNLARLYSIAVLPQFQGKGLARKLLDAVEASAKKHFCVFIRLEVNVSNRPAIALYQKYGYLGISHIPGYYEDGSDAFRMEKRLQKISSKKIKRSPYYQQTMDFTCGPASLMMALKTLDKDYKMNRREELQIWREATTIFMMAGHGGCSPYGLALSAWNRGFQVTLYVNQADTPFLDGVRGEEKKSVVKLVHESFLKQIKTTDIKVKVHDLTADELGKILDTGVPILALISTWQLNRNKIPHWVFVSAADEKFVYINDPDIHDDPHLSQTDYEQVPIERNLFFNMAKFGQKKLRCLLLIRGRSHEHRQVQS
ncbi:MAG: GNAT family N-acetyltransferase/peptidase C39 family protein [Gammaproteobacteria bacterium]|nr:GNAT family N-acetyltransferase/peptidase C39 family protein [Gammaproteobacteria bacterium]